MQVLQDAMTFTAPEGGSNDWIERLRVPALSVGTYCLPAGGIDDQSPHAEDEIYVVATGRALFWTPQEQVKVAAGSVIYVEAGLQHRFVEIEQDLTLLVLFAPAYTGKG